MQKLLTISFLATKLLALYCFSTMGLFAWDAVAEAKSPCHEATGVISQTEEHGQDECNACEIAVDSWDQELVEATEIELSGIVAIIPPTFTEIFEVPVLTTGIYEQYHPPPQVLYKTAFHLPQKTTIILV